MKAKGDIEILLADDERAFRSGMKALLESEGFAVRTARDGEAAVRKFTERVPDVVILDVMMPRMNGFRACEEIRKTDRRVPVVFLTAKDDEVDQVRALGLGADDYVSKSAPEALLVARDPGYAERPEIKRLIGRLRGIIRAAEYAMVEYDIPRAMLAEACRITPGVESPTVAPLSNPDWVAVKAMVRRKECNRIMDELYDIGARGIFVADIRSCRL